MGQSGHLSRAPSPLASDQFVIAIDLPNDDRLNQPRLTEANRQIPKSRLIKMPAGLLWICLNAGKFHVEQLAVRGNEGGASWGRCGAIGRSPGGLTF